MSKTDKLNFGDAKDAVTAFKGKDKGEVSV